MFWVRQPAHLDHIIAVSLLVAFSLVNSIHGFSIGSRSRAVHSYNHRFHAIVPSSDPADFTLIDSSIYKRKPSSVLLAKKQANDSDEKDDDPKNGNFMGIFKKSPGAAIVAPFVLLFGLDLVANIAVITKRSLEVFFTGEYTVWTPWQ